MKIWQRLTSWIVPLQSISSSLQTIATELVIMRELQELELAARTPPIWRSTEAPGKNDTEITYGTDQPKKKGSALENLAAVFGTSSDEEEE